jgi:hypothetical protein
MKKKQLYWIVAIVLILCLSGGFLYNKYRAPTMDDMQSISPRYLNDLSARLKSQGFEFSDKQINDNLHFVDQLRNEGTLNIEDDYYFYPEKGQVLSYREQYLLLFSQ